MVAELLELEKTLHGMSHLTIKLKDDLSQINKDSAKLESDLSQVNKDVGQAMLLRQEAEDIIKRLIKRGVRGD